MAKKATGPLPLPDALFKYKEKDLWWEAKRFSQEEIDKIEAFCNTNSKAFQENFTDKFIENFKKLTNCFGIYLHPLFKQEYSENPKYLIFNNINLDFLTLKILAIINSNEIKCIKFSNNNISKDFKILEPLSVILKNLEKLFFDWNPISIQREFELFHSAIFANANLQFLSLRCNNYSDESLERILHFWTPEHGLKYLELYGNNFTVSGIEKIGMRLKDNKHLEYLGLGKTGLNSISDVEPLLNVLKGEILTSQGLEDFKEKQKQRDLIIEKNSKAKKKDVLEPVPVLPNLLEIVEGKGEYGLWNNISLKYLNLSMNLFQDSDLNGFYDFLKVASPSFVLNVKDNEFVHIDSLPKTIKSKIEINKK